MKCSKCGTDLTEDSKFCSYCGQKVENGEFENGSTAKNDPSGEETDYSVSSSVFSFKSIAEDIRVKGLIFWEKLSLYSKINVAAILVFLLMCLVAYLAGRLSACFIAIVSTALTAASLLANEAIIKVSNKWIHIIAFALAIFLIVPYVGAFRVDYGDAKKFNWSDLVLGDMVPVPHASFGEINSNSESYLSVYIYKTDQKKYDKYVSACKTAGFTIDADESERDYDAFEENGYNLSLRFDENKGKMHICSMLLISMALWSGLMVLSAICCLSPNPTRVGLRKIAKRGSKLMLRKPPLTISGHIYGNA